MFSSSAAGRQRTTRPIVTGTSVLGVVYDGGVMLAADTLLSYGSMAKTQNAQRLKIVPGSHTIVGGSGEYSDFQKLTQILNQKALEETTTSIMDSLDADTSQNMTAENVWHYLRMLAYQRRNKMNPYWNDIVVAGMNLEQQPFLGMVDKIGTTVQDKFVATGFGSYLAMPLLREKWRPDLNEGEARALLEDCCRILFYRDCRASSQIQLAKCSVDATTGKVDTLVSEPYQLDTSWDANAFVQPVADLEGDGGW